MAAAAANQNEGQNEGKRLADLNSATLGASMPEVTLQDGTKIQTGTVGALLVNINKYNALAPSEHQMKADLEAAFRAALPLLIKVGFFDLFSPEEWIADAGSGSGSGFGSESAGNPGRRFVGRLAREYFDKL